MNDFGSRQPDLPARRTAAARATSSRSRAGSSTHQHADLRRPRAAEADRDSPFRVAALTFETTTPSSRGSIDDIRRDRDEHGHRAGATSRCSIASTRSATRSRRRFLNAGIPCRLAQGRALAEDPVVAYVIAALRVIASPDDDRRGDAFFELRRSRRRCSTKRAREAERDSHDLRARARATWRSELPRATHENATQIRRALPLRNLDALGRQHTTLDAARAGAALAARRQVCARCSRSSHDELSDPAVACRRSCVSPRVSPRAREQRIRSGSPRLGGVEIALKGMLDGVGIPQRVASAAMPPDDAELILPRRRARRSGCRSALFKALQLWRCGDIGVGVPRLHRDRPRDDRQGHRRAPRSSRSPRCACATADRRRVSLAREARAVASTPGAAETHGISRRRGRHGADVRGRLAESSRVLRRRRRRRAQRLRLRLPDPRAAWSRARKRSSSARTTRCRSRASSFATSRKLSDLARAVRDRHRARRIARSTTRARSRTCVLALRRR